MLTKSPMLNRCGSPTPLFIPTIHKCILNGFNFGVMVATAFVIAYVVFSWIIN